MRYIANKIVDCSRLSAVIYVEWICIDTILMNRRLDRLSRSGEAVHVEKCSSGSRSLHGSLNNYSDLSLCAKRKVFRTQQIWYTQYSEPRKW